MHFKPNFEMQPGQPTLSQQLFAINHKIKYSAKSPSGKAATRQRVNQQCNLYVTVFSEITQMDTSKGMSTGKKRKKRSSEPDPAQAGHRKKKRKIR